MRNRIAPKGARRQSGRPENQASEADPLAPLTPLRRARAEFILDMLEREGDLMALEFLRRRAQARDCLRAAFERAVDDLAVAKLVTVESTTYGVIVRRVQPAAGGDAA